MPEKSVGKVIDRVVKGLCGSDAVAIAQSDGLPWNGWCVYENGFAEFRAGLFWDYLENLKIELEKEGLKDTEFYEWVKECLKNIKEEWKEWQ